MILLRNTYGRQLKRLVNEHKYDPKQIMIEYTLQVGSRKPRADIVIWEKDLSKKRKAQSN